MALCNSLAKLRHCVRSATLCLALLATIARSDGPVSVSNAEEFVAAVQGREELIMVVQHLNMAGQPLGELKGFESMAIWGNCSDPLPVEATSLDVPTTYFRPNMCAVFFDDTVPIYQSTGQLWLSNMAMFATLADQLVNVTVVSANSTLYVVDSVIANSLFTGVRAVDSRLTVVGTAFVDNGGGTPPGTWAVDFDVQAISMNNPNTDVAVVTDSYLTTALLVAGIPDFGLTTAKTQTQTIVLARNVIAGSAKIGQCVGLCVNYNATGQTARPTVYTDLPSSKYGFLGDTTSTALPLSGVTWAMVQPSSDDSEWLASLNEAGVVGAVRESWDPLGLGPAPPPPDASDSDSDTDSNSPQSTRSVPPTSTTSKSKSSVGAIVGGVVGGVVGLLLIAVLVMYLARRKRRAPSGTPNPAYKPTNPADEPFGVPPQPAPTTTPTAAESYPYAGAYAVAAAPPSGHPGMSPYAGSWAPGSGEGLPYAAYGAHNPNPNSLPHQPSSLPGGMPPQPSSLQGSVPPSPGAYVDSAYTIPTQNSSLGALPPVLAKANSQNNTLSSLDTKTQGSLHVSSGALLESGTATSASAPRSRGDKAADVDLLQQQLEALCKAGKPLIGRYRILPGSSERRVGGQGVVQFCAHMHDPNRKYAVKFFLDRGAFFAEHALYQNNDLRGILPPVDDVISNEDGHVNALGRPLPPMVVLEKGEALDAWAHRCSPDFPSCVQIIMHLVKRIADLHAKGYVHRDLKPANCLFLFSNNAWTICDFGCCVPIGSLAGLSYTLAYAAPETVQASIRGDKQVVADPAVDVWALGLMAYELFSRTRVFPAGSNTTVHRIMQGEQPLRWEDMNAPSRSSELRMLGFMKDGILAMLQRDPAARISLADVHRMWKAVLGQETTMAFA